MKDELRNALWLSPKTKDGAQLVEYLQRLDNGGEPFKDLRDAFRSKAEAIARRFIDVISVEDAFGTFSERLFDRWIPSYLDEIATGNKVKPFGAFVFDRFKDYLKELRKKKNRRQLLTEKKQWTTQNIDGESSNFVEIDESQEVAYSSILAGSVAAPDERLRLAEAVDSIEDHLSLEDAQIVRMLAKGLSQRDIANILDQYESTISNRVKILRDTLYKLVLGEQFQANTNRQTTKYYVARKNQ